MNNSFLKIAGPTITLRPLVPDDATEEYCGWLNDPEVNQYLEVRFSHHTLESVRHDIENITRDADVLFLGIIRNDTGKHIGNIRLRINPHHRSGAIGLMIGDKASWGRGYATEAITLLSGYAFGELHCHKLTAGAYHTNVGSVKAFLKAGFKEEGRTKEDYLSHGVYVDHVLLGKINESP